MERLAWRTMPFRGSTLYLLPGYPLRREGCLPGIQHRVHRFVRQLLGEQRQRLIFGRHEATVSEDAALGAQRPLRKINLFGPRVGQRGLGLKSDVEAPRQ